MLFELLHFCPIFDVDRENSASRISNKKFSVSMVKANTGDVSSRKFSEYRDESPVSCIPDFNTLGVGSDNCIENRIVKHTNTSLIIS